MTFLVFGYILGILSCAGLVYFLLRCIKPTSVNPNDMLRIQNEAMKLEEERRLRGIVKMCLTQYCGAV